MLSLIATLADATVQGVEDTTKDTTTVEATAGTTAGTTAGIRIIKETTLAVTCTKMVIQIITSNQIEDGRKINFMKMLQVPRFLGRFLECVNNCTGVNLYFSRLFDCVTYNFIPLLCN